MSDDKRLDYGGEGYECEGEPDLAIISEEELVLGGEDSRRFERAEGEGGI